MNKKFESIQEFLTTNEARIAYENALGDDKASEIAKTKAILDEALKVFNEKIIGMQYDDILIECQTDPESKNPTLKAITLGSLVAYGCKPNKKTGMVDFVEKMVIIDLHDLNARAKKINRDTKIFNNPSWVYWVEALNHALFEERKGSSEIKSLSDKYETFKITEPARELKIDFSTIAGKTKCIQAVMDAILFAPYVGKDGKEDETKNRYKVLTKHAKTLNDNYSTWSRKTKTGIVLPTEGAFRQQLMRILFSIVTGTEFKAE